MEFITAPKADTGCIFCEKPRAADAREELVLAVTRRSVVMLNKYPYANAHLLVAPRRHADDLSALPAADHADLAETLRRSIAIVRRQLRPGGLNVGMNLGAPAGAGIADHLHWHVVPRWPGDVNFMAVVGSVRVINEHLLATYDRLAPEFARLGAPGRAAGR